MEVPVNRFKRALRESRPQIGLWSVLANGSVTELLGTSGYDWLLIDMEHAPNELPAVQAQLQALRGTVTAPIVRPYDMRTGPTTPSSPVMCAPTP